MLPRYATATTQPGCWYARRWNSSQLARYSSAGESQLGIGDQALAQADRAVLHIAETPIELDRFGIGFADLQVQLRAAALQKRLLHVLHQRAAEPSASQPRRHGQVIDPAAMPFVTRHHARHDRAVGHADQEELGLHRELARDVLARVVPRAREPTFFPERDDCGLVAPLVRPDLHRQEDSAATTT